MQNSVLSFRLRVSFATCSLQMLFRDTASSLEAEHQFGDVSQIPLAACCLDQYPKGCLQRLIERVVVGELIEYAGQPIRPRQIVANLVCNGQTPPEGWQIFAATHIAADHSPAHALPKLLTKQSDEDFENAVIVSGHV